MSEAALYVLPGYLGRRLRVFTGYAGTRLQGYLANKKQPPPLGPP